MIDAGQETVGAALLAGLLVLRVVLAVHELVAGARRRPGGWNGDDPERTADPAGRPRRRGH